MKVDDAAVDQAEQNVARQNQIDVAELRRRLAADGIDARAVPRRPAQPDVAARACASAKSSRQVKVSDLEIDQFMREQQRQHRRRSALEINLAHMLVAVPEDASDAQVGDAAGAGPARAASARAPARTSPTLAQRILRCARRARNGGQMGLRSADRYPPLFVEATRNLRRSAASPDRCARAPASMCSRCSTSASAACRRAPSRKAMRATSCCAPDRS